MGHFGSSSVKVPAFIDIIWHTFRVHPTVDCDVFQGVEELL